MQRSLVLALILLIAAVIGGIWLFWLGGTAAPPPRPGPPITEPDTSEPVSAVVAGDQQGDRSAAPVRDAVVSRGSELLEDPDIRAGLCGFRGRVVDHREVPVADCGVRIYRGALDSVLQLNGDLFAEQQEFEPNYIAGEVRTRDDGTFQITGVWPRGFYLMFAGLDTDAPTHQVITDVPSPGEIVDLGDIVLNDAGVIVGTVYDDEGNPLPGALVRAADIPGAFAAFFPVERFDPEGAVLIRERQSPVRVLQMPAWVKRAFEHLPIPTTRTGADGSFRLVGVVPGSNMLATTARNFLSDVKASVQVRAGQERDVGRIRLRRGEELVAKVVDQQEKPVVGAEVVAGSTLSMVPFDLGQNLGQTDEQGYVAGTGFSPGKATVAARRGPQHAWVLAEPQSILGEVVVTLPSLFAANVTVTLADGSPAKSPDFRLIYGRMGDGAPEMYLMGFTRPIPLEDRLEQVDDGQWRLKDLHAGTYTLIAEVAGQSTGSASFEVAEGDAAVALQLATPNVFTVRVVNQADEPIRNVAIFAEARGEKMFDMPVRCGLTDKEGLLVVDKLQADSLRVSADHPRWGVVHGEAKKDEELLLRLLPPGTLHGVLRENGKAPLPGKFTVAVMLRRGDGPRGPLEQVPSLVTPGLDGSFTVDALQPGSYRVASIDSLASLRSPGTVFAFAQGMFMSGGRGMDSESVDVVSGQTVEVVLDVGEKPLEGPTAQLTGSLIVDGRLGEGYAIMARSGGRRFAATVDERGRFDLGTISAGQVSVTVMGGEGGVFMGPGSSLWSDRIEIEEGALRELTIEIATASMAGVCYLPDGSPAAGAFVQARGSNEGRGDVRLVAPADANGAFRFGEVPEGVYSLEVQVRNDEERWKGRLEGIDVVGGLPVTGLRIDLIKPRMVKGRVDLAVFGDERPRWSSLRLYRLNGSDPDGAEGDRAGNGGVDRDTGEFTVQDIEVGRYRVELRAWTEQGRKDYACGILVVPPAGLTEVVLVPRPQ